jgi:hypothetical protein
VAYGFFPTALKQISVTFNTMPGEVDYTEAKARGSISLSSFRLKMMEKQIEILWKMH